MKGKSLIAVAPVAALMALGVLCASTVAHADVKAQAAPSKKEACLSANELVKTDETLRQKWHDRVKERPIVIGAVHGGFLMGSGLNGAYSSDPISSFGYGWDLGARADVALLSPLWLAGRVQYFGGNGSNIQLDALAGFNFSTYGNRWVKAGNSVTNTGGVAIVRSWGSHCQLRRDSYQLLGGVKLIATAGEKGDADDVFALQAGLQNVFNNRRFSHWSIFGLYDPTSTSYGAQGSLGLGGIYGLPAMFYTEMSAGALLGGKSTFWTTINIGLGLEI